MKKLDEERIHMENLVNSRFNYLMVILAIIIAGVLSSKSQDQARILFICGMLISLGLGWTILRAQKRLDILLNKIYEDSSHSATYAKNEAEKSQFFNPAKYSARKIIGYFFPICIVIFMLWGSIQPNLIFFEEKEDNKISELKLKNKAIEERLSRIENIFINNNESNSNKASLADEKKSRTPDN
jgi:hypothetical protein